ncbi:phospholipase D-like domain-containing protein [Aquisphaera insulae]|uniref:phospholipase D-like domain-containing protein n=1 Tax=Aquisphaera insulae TaxID=2712864 RepID=UPI0013EDFA74|nr:phospholipase D-like domain-containing protein [Aquisphaera insulae]
MDHDRRASQRAAHNEDFVNRLIARRPELRDQYQRSLAPKTAQAESTTRDGRRRARERVLETIVNDERPVLFVRGRSFDTAEVAALGPEAVDLVRQLDAASNRLAPVLPLVGRIDVVNFPGTDFVGTAWFVAEDIVVTNRHVASLIALWDGRRFAFSSRIAGQPIQASWCYSHEYDDPPPRPEEVLAIQEVLYIEPESGPNDIAFLRVARRAADGTPRFIPIAATDAGVDVPVCVVGFPARASRRVIPDQALMERLYRGKFDVKRAAPGLGMGTRGGAMEHDCTTLGGNSGSVVLDLKGNAVGLHFAGLYQEANYAVRATTLSEYIRRERWRQPPDIREIPPPAAPPPDRAPVVLAGTPPGAVGVMIPLTLTLSLGTPVVLGAGTPATAGLPATGDEPSIPTVAQTEEAVRAFWASRPADVVAARVGFEDVDGRIGDRPFVAASVRPDRLAAARGAGPSRVLGVPVHYFPADVAEQVEALPAQEAVEEIAYDDDARTGPEFSFDPIEEEMELILHVGPEYSWEKLEEFLDGTGDGLTASMFEFHATHIKDAIQARLEAGTKLRLVLDYRTFSRFDGGEGEFDRVAVFEEWADRFHFHRIVAPGGGNGLMAKSYHTKVAVRDDGKFWLSSGNWKPDSSQPIVTQDQRDNAADEDLPGNREWHVVVTNSTLADRFRNHIVQDYLRSEELGGRELPQSQLDESFVLAPMEEEVELERRPPGRVKPPRTIRGRIRVRPLMTPDREGAVYSEAVLELIRSARRSLLFQIPYIGMPSNPRVRRGFIDDLIDALTTKMKTLDDARVILRSGVRGSKDFSSPTHTAWYFKSKDVDIANRLRGMEDHHTKGMIVDGQRILIGSHNWSKPGVTLNRDASLIFDNVDVAGYYADAFELDWQRASPIRPRRFVPEFAMTESVGFASVPRFRRVWLSDLGADD